MPRYELALIVKAMQRFESPWHDGPVVGVRPEASLYFQQTARTNDQPDDVSSRTLIMDRPWPRHWLASSVSSQCFSIIVFVPELHDAVKRTCHAIIERGGIIRKMENLGFRTLPYKMSNHGQRHVEGNYFLFHFNSPANKLVDLEEHMNRDIDMIRTTVLHEELPFQRPCDKGPCQFGEIVNPDHERRTWRFRALQKINFTKKDKERLL